MSYLNNDERPSYEMPPVNSKNIELQSSGVASAALCYGSPASADLCQKKRYFLRIGSNLSIGWKIMEKDFRA
jgi:hypothetical protein